MLFYLRLLKESFAFAMNALRNNKLRTLLSLLGVTIGIFSIIAVLAAVDSLDRKIKSDLMSLDKNTIYVTSISFGPTDIPKWKREQLKPTLNLGYNLLTQPIGTNNFQSLSPNNYKFGMTAYVPLLLRKERASFKQAKLKLENATLDVTTKKRDFETKVQTLRNEIKQMKQMQITQMKLVEHSKSLRDSEQIRFESGESSLFLVNAREVSYLSSKFKLVEIEIKLMVNLLKLKWLMNSF
jgi:hypothetical protein